VQFLVTVAVLMYGANGKAPVPDPQPAIAAAVRANGDIAVRPNDDWAGALDKRVWVDRAALEFFRRGALLVSEGRRALGRVELAEAEEKLAAAEAVYTGELWRPGAASEAALAAVWHGVALFELSRRVAAESAFRRALALEPATNLTDAQVRPDIVRAFAQARVALPRAPVQLHFNRECSSIAIIIDGGAPYESDDACPDELEMAVGPHFLQARAVVESLVVEPVAQLIDVKPGDKQLAINLTVDTIETRLRTLREVPTAEGVRALFDTIAIDDALLVAVGKDGGTQVLAAQRVRPGCATATVVSPHADELWQRARAAECRPGQKIDVLAAPLIVHSRSPSLVQVRPRPVTPVWRRPWLWVGLVGALGVGVVIAASVVPRAASYTGTLDFHAFALGVTR
jgi:hypothetical protein